MTPEYSCVCCVWCNAEPSIHTIVPTRPDILSSVGKHAMREYDRSQPLIVIHVPKAAGTSSQKIFQNWFGEGFLRHYFNEQTGEMPDKHDLFGIHTVNKPLLLHGHFNRLRNFGVEDYYPEAKQFITILRDPFELTVSHYFYTRKNTSNWKDQSRVPTNTLREYLLNTKPNMLNHFPREMSLNNYKEVIEDNFIDIGITEYLGESMKRIASKLNLPYDSALLGHYNVTERDQEVPDQLRDMFIENNQLEFAVYDYALEKHIQQGGFTGC